MSRKPTGGRNPPVGNSSIHLSLSYYYNTNPPSFAEQGAAEQDDAENSVKPPGVERSSLAAVSGLDVRQKMND
jgi:hypothetical protein